jgi:ABC-type metal ion transport system substrate-binding protein
MKIKLAEALLRRKELQGKVDMLRVIKDKDLFEVKVNRQNVTESVDNIIAQVPKLSVSEATKQFDWHARQLRLVDAAIQQANWTSEVEVNDSTMDDFKD